MQVWTTQLAYFLLAKAGIELLTHFAYRNDLSKEEYDSMKVETLDQIQEFTATLDRLNKGDVTLNSRISSMRHVCSTCFSFVVHLIKLNLSTYLQTIRKAIANSFNTVEMIRILGDQSINEQANQLAALEESHKLKRIPPHEYQSKKVSDCHCDCYESIF